MQDLLMFLSHRVVSVALSLALGIASHGAQAGVVIDGTRQIYPEQRREVTIRVTNDDKHAPRLVQAWLDAGDPEAAPTLSDVPFVMSPPGISPGRRQKPVHALVLHQGTVACG